MTSWSREELIDSIAESIRRKAEHERRIIQETQYQESLYEILRQLITKKADLPRAFE